MNSNVNVTDRETLWRQRVGLFFQNVFASEVSWKNKDVWGGQETPLILFFSLSLISSCSERERLHPQSQSQGTDSGHSIHHYAPAGRGQCATGNMVLLQSSRAKFCTRYGHLPSHGSWRIPISGNRVHAGQRQRGFKLHFRRAAIKFCKGCSCRLNLVTP